MGNTLRWLVPALLVGALPAQSPPAEREREARPFCRFVEQGPGGRLELLVAGYRRGDVAVTLHASLHVADRGHYMDLQKRFAAFDALLYELVADADLRPHPQMELADDDLLSLLLGRLGNSLQLVDQCKVLDYRHANFAHADMTHEELDAALAAARSSLLGQLATPPPEVDREAEARQPKPDLVAAYRSGRGLHELRMMAARLMAEPDAERREPNVLIEGRNERCLAVLDEQIRAGRKHLGIYYGAAHMDHLERRLLGMGFANVSEEWLLAWDCDPARFPPVEKGLQQKRYRARRDIELLLAAVVAWATEHPGTEPTWSLVRAAQPQAKLPGRTDGKDPWGRAYVLRRNMRGGFEVRSAGSDGTVDTDDDVLPESPAPQARTKAGDDFDPFGWTNEAKVAKAKADTQTIHELARLFRIRNNRWPTLAELTAADAQGHAYLDEALEDGWGRAYLLETGERPGSLRVSSLGPDGKASTDDDIVYTR